MRIDYGTRRRRVPAAFDSGARYSGAEQAIPVAIPPLVAVTNETKDILNHTDSAVVRPENFSDRLLGCAGCVASTETSDPAPPPAGALDQIELCNRISAKLLNRLRYLVDRLEATA
ncbi:hypothetical protein [Sphingomonas faeni]|uniref:hypothetical protein n=1 Tax=Sphingomonas faeni TaxID=185950 RepID=UPI0020C77991|nr:hypothetical protein [Sphingomonas faeni]MCP8890029.1 hypothetical protein [Sphingomonas faeni]